MHTYLLRQGFTLLEVAVVLVIIALITGGVLIGRDLIVVAGIRAQISQMEEIETAVNAFKLKYRCIPGDCLDATSYGLDGQPSSYGGDGDGVVEYVPSGNVFSESMDFWHHLSAAGFLDHTPTVYYGVGEDITPGRHTPPLALEGGGLRNGGNFNAAGGVMVVEPTGVELTNPLPNQEDLFEDDVRNVYWLTSYSLTDRQNGVYGGNVSFRIDQKIDDGLPRSGTVRAINLAAFQWYAGGTYGGNANSCLRDDLAPVQYNQAGTGGAPWSSLCSILTKAKF